jgi:carbon-monoxide dehydrogenase medium subunit
MMGVAVQVELDGDGVCRDARLIYLNAGDGPIEAEQAQAILRGETPSDELFTSAAIEAADKEIDPMGNIHATVDFQRHLARVLTKRALEKAVARAQAQLT